MTEEVPVRVEEFRDGETIPHCKKCEKRLADMTRDSDFCVICLTAMGELCNEEGCLAEPEVSVTHRRTHYCKSHGMKRLFEKATEVLEAAERIKELERSVGPKDYHINEDIMTNSIKKEVEKQKDVLPEIEQLQDQLDVTVIHLD